MILPNGFEIEQEKIGVKDNVKLCIKDGKRYALKLFYNNFEQYSHEVYICKTLKRHNNVVELIDNFELPEHKAKAMVFEYCSKDLKSHLQSADLSLQERLILFGQIVSAFKDIQEDLNQIQFQFQHRDIKPENLLIGEDNQIKFDFGESRIIDTGKMDDIYQFIPSTQHCGTPGYMDPMMVYLNGGFTEKSDLWSLGTTLFYILTSKQLQLKKAQINKGIMDLPSNLRKARKIMRIQEQIEAQIRQCIEKEECKQLLRNLLDIDTEHRYDWCQLFSDQFVNLQLMQIPYVECKQFVRKKIIRLRDDINSKFFSSSFERDAGKKLSLKLQNIISQGLCYFQTVSQMLEIISELIEKNGNFLEHWQNFEKCNYLLHLRSLFIFHDYNQIFTQLKCQHGKEGLDENLIIDLRCNENQTILERIQLQFYYLFDCVKKSLVGNGLEARIIKLQQESDDKDYPNTLQFSAEEKVYFSYKKYDPKNILNDPDFFEKEQFFDLLRKYLMMCIKCCFQNYQYLKKKQARFLKDLTILYDSERSNAIEHWKINFQEDDILSKIRILFSIINKHQYLAEMFDSKSIFNTYFYFEIIYFEQSEENAVEKVKQYIYRNFPVSLCFTFKKEQNERNIILNLKFQQRQVQLWCFNDGIEKIKIIRKVEKIIQNLE